jgi:hypothetical protein
MSQEKAKSEQNDPYKVAVVIPVYKPFAELSANEMQTLVQIRTVLCARDLFLIYPEFINIQEYISLFRPLQVNTLVMKDKYFGNYIRGNRLGVSEDLYIHFSAYEYILMHHIDAYVFSDQLDYWCSQDLDYIGAPWFVGNHHPVLPLKFRGVGNGGFSLRRTKSFMEIAQNRTFVKLHIRLAQVYDFLEGDHYLLLRKLLGINTIKKKIKPFAGNEDEFWGITVPLYHKWFKVAKPEQALKFSFEVMPAELFRMNDYELPFGCHGWEKYDPEFWQNFIVPEKENKIPSSITALNIT